MVDVTRKFTAEVPIEKAAAFLRDFANAPTWDPGTESCTQDLRRPCRRRNPVAQRVQAVRRQPRN